MKPRPGALDAQRAAEWSRARARAARGHHPDLGGDVNAYLEALREVDLRYGVGPAGTARVQVHRSRAPGARLRRGVRATRRWTGRLTKRLPDRFRPGPAYIDL